MIFALRGGAAYAGAVGQSTGLPGTAAEAAVDDTLTQAREAGQKSDLVRARQLYAQAARQAQDAHYGYGRATATVGLGNCELGQFAFRRALAKYLEARQLAQPLNNALLTGRIAVNIAAVYIILNSAQEASTELDRGIPQLRQAAEHGSTQAQGREAEQVLARALLMRARVRFDQHDEKGWRGAISEAIAEARANRGNGGESEARYYLGYYCLRSGQYEEANQELEAAFRLAAPGQEAPIRVVLAAVLLQRGHGREALALLDATLAAQPPSLKLLVRHEMLDWRGRMLRSLGRNDEALAEFRKATSEADRWRASALPGDVSSTNTLSYPVLQSVYIDHYQLAARLALERKSDALAREALEVVARQRAANLREEAAVSLQRQQRLPPEYYQLLAQLKGAQAQALAHPGGAEELSASQIREQLAQIEDKVGLPAAEFSRDGETNLHQKSLRDIQQCLGTEDVLLSFALGGEGSQVSFLWATTRNSVMLYELATRDRLERAGRNFREAVRAHGPIEEKGGVLRHELFGKLAAPLLAKRHWLLALDGDLLSSVPWAALPEPAGSAEPLIEKHDIRLLPTEMLLMERKRMPQGDGFVAVGDPVYNRADSRILPAVRQTNSAKAPPNLAITRLVGSSEEVRASARTWNSAATAVLTGLQATADEFNKALENEKPAVIHFAVHILSPEQHPEEAALALSLGTNGLPELLTEEVVSTFRVPGSIVVLSGCASENGRVVPGAGLVGLSRAWLLAGASAVVVSAWPTPDDAGRFFEVFYRQLAKNKKSMPLGEGAAMALEQAQQEMRRDGGFRKSPAYWAAYAMISKE